jgi:hypothetical protein
MWRFGLSSTFALALCLVPGAGLLAQDVDPLWFLRSERQPVYAPASESEAASGVVQMSYDASGACVTDGACTSCSSGCDGCSGDFRSRWALWREHIRCRLRRHHWEDGFDTCYPVCPPLCQEYYGYRPTCWRRLPPYNPCPPATSQHVMPPAPQQPYAPLIQPGSPVPPAPAELIAPPAPAAELP